MSETGVFPTFNTGMYLDHVQAERQARWKAQQKELEEVRKANDTILGKFIANLDRPMSAEEQDVFLRAHAGLDIPPSNPLNLQPMPAPTPWGHRPRVMPAHESRCVMNSFGLSDACNSRKEK